MIERAFRILSPLALLLVWEVVVRMQLLDARFFPPPSAIAGDFAHFAASGELWTNTLVTLQRVLIGFLIGAIPGTALGLLIGTNRIARAIVDPVIAILYPIPKIAILPLVLLLFGIGEASKYAIVAIGVFFLMAINTAAGVRQIDPIYFDVARSYLMRPLTFYMHVLLPGALVNVFAGIKLAIGIGIVLAIAAEFSAAKSGLGFTIWNAWQTLAVERMYVALVMVSLVGYLLTLAANQIEFWLLPWRAQRP